MWDTLHCYCEEQSCSQWICLFLAVWNNALTWKTCFSWWRQVMKHDHRSSDGGKWINKGGDGTDVGSVFQIEVLQESKMMIPDCHRRLAIAHADLLQLLVSNTQSPFKCEKPFSCHNRMKVYSWKGIVLLWLIHGVAECNCVCRILLTHGDKNIYLSLN